MPCNISDFLIYLIADAAYAKLRSLAHIVDEAIRGGVTAVQYRDKTATADVRTSIARELRAVTERHGIPLIINDHPETAVAVQADGVHVGQGDISAMLVRRIVGDQMVVGVTARTREQMAEATRAGADYIGFGPVFPTRTKKNPAPVAGLDGLRSVADEVDIPIIAIGGITAETAARVIEAGASGVAIAAAIMDNGNPREAAARIRASLSTRN